MTIGEKIKLARILRDITQKDLGVSLGFPASSAAVCIAQYENNSRIPKPNQLQSIADVFNIPMEFFSQNSLETNINIMHTLFEIDNIWGISVQQYVGGGGDLERYAIVFDDTQLNGHIGKWYKKLIDMSYQMSNADDVSKEEIKKDYSLWKARYLESMLDDEVVTNSGNNQFVTQPTASIKNKNEIVDEQYCHILLAIKKFISGDNVNWRGTSTELVEILSVDVKPNALSMILDARAGLLLDEYSILYEKGRNHKGRFIKLSLQTKNKI